jgi:hypothetical protein
MTVWFRAGQQEGSSDRWLEAEPRISFLASLYGGGGGAAFSLPLAGVRQS